MKKYIFDNNKIEDKASLKGTTVVIKDKSTGKVIFRGSNKVIVSGSEFGALKNFAFHTTTEVDMADKFNSSNNEFNPTIISYDVALADANHTLDVAQEKAFVSSSDSSNIMYAFNGQTPITTDDGLTKLYEYFSRRIFLFAVGIDGCGLDNSKVYKVSNTKWIKPYGTGENALIPFKHKICSSTFNTDLTSSERDKYFGRSCIPNSNNTYNVEYYFKTFDEPPKLHIKPTDGSVIPLDSTIWDIVPDADTVVELSMSIDGSDCREYFSSIGGSNSGRINTISLLSAVPYRGKDLYGIEVDGVKEVHTFYENIRPYTKYNFPNESLIDASKNLEISYYLYF